MISTALFFVGPDLTVSKQMPVPWIIHYQIQFLIFYSASVLINSMELAMYWFNNARVTYSISIAGVSLKSAM